MSSSPKIVLDQSDLYHYISCPITYEIYETPIVLACGHTFEQSAVCDLIIRKENFCPICRKSFVGGDSINYQLRNIINIILDKTPKINLEMAPTSSVQEQASQEIYEVQKYVSSEKKESKMNFIIQTELISIHKEYFEDCGYTVNVKKIRSINNAYIVSLISKNKT